MRVSLSKIALIEKLIFSTDLLTPEDKVLLESYKILDTEFELGIRNQRRTTDLIMKSGRNELIQEIEQVHSELFDPTSNSLFRINMLNIFCK